MEKVLQISISILVAAAGIIFACAEGSPLAGVTVFVALFSLFFIDWQKSFVVPSPVANVLGLLAFIVAAGEFFSGNIEARLLSGGHLIVYLTWVFLIQQKGNRHYWWLCALSLLQVAVASVLTNEIWYGFALFLYTFLACWTLAVFQMVRATSDIESSSEQLKQPRLIVGSTQKGIARDIGQGLLSWRFFSTTSFVFCMSMGMTTLFFLFTPRVWIGRYSIYGDAPVAAQPLTGFTEEVRLGDMGEILENNATVAEVTIFDHESNRQFSEEEMLDYLGPEPLFRGATQELYVAGNWKRIRSYAWEYFPPDQTPAIRQAIQLEPLGVKTIFGFGNIIGMKGDNGIDPEVEPYSAVFLKIGARRKDKYSYQVLANPGRPDLAQSNIRKKWDQRMHFRFGNYLNQVKAVPENLSQLKQIAADVVKNKASELEAARAIENYLLDPTIFSYSLKQEIQDPTIDPVEDFLINRKQGHCEYFASAMVLMLRCAGIPSRMVTGFKGGFQQGNVFKIQQLHAHSWVEAYIDGQWITFDPTSTTRNESVEAREGAIPWYQQAKISMKEYWDAGVRMSPSQQREIIYKPVQTAMVSTSSVIKELLQGNLESLQNPLLFLKSPERWISWQGGVVVFCLLSILSALVMVVRKLIQLMKKLSIRRRQQKRVYQQVEFYSRFQKLLAAEGIIQKPTQTAREFLEASLPQLQAKLTATGLSTWSVDLVEKFYRVRFGDHALTSTEAASIDARLSELENCLHSG